MQNTSDRLYINKAKIINMKSEILCREAEDDFFYFNKINSAFKKLNEAVKLSPYHLKSILLLADIAFIKGFIKKSLNLYLKAETINPDLRTLAGIANCYNSLGDYDNALIYCNKAIELITLEDFSLYSQIIEMKIYILTAQKKYKAAYKTFIHSQNILDKNSLTSIYNINYELLNEKINLQSRLIKSKLKIV